MGYHGRMLSRRRLLCALFLSACLGSCTGSSDDTSVAAVRLPPLSKNCELLHQRFEEFASPDLCKGMSATNVLTSKPKMGGALLQSVNRKQVKLGVNQKEYFVYTLSFQSRTKAFDVTTISAADVDFAPQKFYSVDLMSNCRYEQLKQEQNSVAELLSGFQLPKRLACF